MPAAYGEEDPRQTEPNWVDKWAFYVSVVGVLAVAFYGWQAWVANGLTRKLIGEGSRPFIQIIVDPTQQVKKVLRVRSDATSVNTIGITYSVWNIGKLPGKGKLRAIVKWSPIALTEPPDITQETMQEEFIWPNSGSAIPLVAYGADNMTDGEYADLRSGTGFVYFRAEMKYGIEGQYTTSVCWQISLAKANDDLTNPMMAKLAAFSLWPTETTAWPPVIQECPTAAN
jgi:hypothetical protein